MEYWKAELLNRDEQSKGELGGITGGSLKWSSSSAVPGSGDLNLTQLQDLEVNWLSDRLRVVHYNNVTPTFMGTWLLSNPGWQWDRNLARTTIKLLDKCELLNSAVGRWYNLKKGTNVTTYIRAIITQYGDKQLQLTNSPLNLTTALSWEPTATWLEIVNVLLKSINYHPLWVDTLGRFRAEPYTYPGRQPLADTYGASPFLKMKPQYKDEAPLYDIPTGVVVYSKGDEEEPGYLARADLPDEHPFSAANREENIYAESVEATSQSVAQGLADRLLATKVSVTRRATVTHPIDHTNLYDAVHHAPLGFNGKIVERTVTLGKGAVVEDTIERLFGSGELLW